MTTEILSRTEYYTFEGVLNLAPTGNQIKNPLNIPITRWNVSSYVLCFNYQYIVLAQQSASTFSYVIELN